jgi:hypothetical protein
LEKINNIYIIYMPRTLKRKNTHSRKKMRGGDGSGRAVVGAGGAGGANWMLKTVGDLNSQIGKALAPGKMTNTLTGGSRKRRAGTYKKHKSTRRAKRSASKTRKRRGGFVGSVISTALVPFGLFAAQRKLAKRMKKKGKK